MERVGVAIIGGGQAGLATSYHLRQRGVDHLVLEAGARIGASWRNRWDSLRLFTPARYDGLPGMRFPAPANSFPTKDEMADYLESYVANFSLPVRLGASVTSVSQGTQGFRLDTGTDRLKLIKLSSQAVLTGSRESLLSRASSTDQSHSFTPASIAIHSS